MRIDVQWDGDSEAVRRVPLLSQSGYEIPPDGPTSPGDDTEDGDTEAWGQALHLLHHRKALIAVPRQLVDISQHGLQRRVKLAARTLLPGR